MRNSANSLGLVRATSEIFRFACARMIAGHGARTASHADVSMKPINFSNGWTCQSGQIDWTGLDVSGQLEID